MNKFISIAVSVLCFISLLSFMSFAEDKDFYKYTAPSNYNLVSDYSSSKIWTDSTGETALELSIYEIDDEHYGVVVADSGELKKLEKEMADAFKSSIEDELKNSISYFNVNVDTVKFKIEKVGKYDALVAIFKAKVEAYGNTVGFYGKIIEFDSFNHEFVFSDLKSNTEPDFDSAFIKSLDSFEILESKASKVQKFNPTYIIGIVVGALSVLFAGIKGKKRKSNKTALDANGMPAQDQPVYYNPQADSTLNTGYNPTQPMNNPAQPMNNPAQPMNNQGSYYPGYPTAPQQSNQTSFNPDADPWEQ